MATSIEMITPAEAAVRFRHIVMPDMRQFHPDLMSAKRYDHKGYEVAEIGICTWFDTIDFDKWFNDLPVEAREGFAVGWPLSDAALAAGSWCSGAAPHYYWQGLLLRAWLSVWDAAYYAAPREDFSTYAALDQAVQKRCPWVVTEDLS